MFTIIFWTIFFSTIGVVAIWITFGALYASGNRVVNQCYEEITVFCCCCTIILIVGIISLAAIGMNTTKNWRIEKAYVVDIGDITYTKAEVSVLYKLETKTNIDKIYLYKHQLPNIGDSLELQVHQNLFDCNYAQFIRRIKVKINDNQ